jgi:hypothetical protein
MSGGVGGDYDDDYDDKHVALFFSLTPVPPYINPTFITLSLSVPPTTHSVPFSHNAAH